MIRKIVMANLLMVSFSAAFSFHGPPTMIITTSTPRITQDTFSLSAKKAVTKKKTSQKKQQVSSFGGGFGKAVATPEVPPDNDYSVFPALDLEVVKTILSSPDEFQRPGPLLPDEVYDRLDQIYGFPKFNFPALNADGPESTTSSSRLLSLKEWMSSSSTPDDEGLSSTSSSTSSSSSSSSKMSNLEFADLLASATGDQSPFPLSATVSPTVDRTPMEAIARLPPFTNLRVLHVDPLVLAVDDFFTDEECARYIALSERPHNNGLANDDADAEEGGGGAFQTRSKTVGKDRAAQSQRTSTTWFHHYKNVPELMSKASRLLGLDGIDQWEEAQTVRYRRNEKFTWHLDALSPDSPAGAGGQRTATLLVYLTDLQDSDGGATIFRDLSYNNGDRLRV